MTLGPDHTLIGVSVYVDEFEDLQFILKDWIEVATELDGPRVALAHTLSDRIEAVRAAHEDAQTGG